MKYRSLSFILILCVFVLAACNFSSDTNDSNNEIPSPPPNTSEPEPTPNVSKEGGIVEITDTTSPIFGAKIAFDSQALFESETVTLSYSDNLPGPFEILSADVTPVVLSKTLVIERTGELDYDSRALVTIPYDKESVPEGLVPIIVYWDEQLGGYSAIEVVEVDSEAGMITFATSHASHYLAIALATLSDIGIAKTSVDTKFRPNLDGFFLSNFGSYISPGGNCFGMVAYATWYFNAKRVFGEKELINKYKQGDLAETFDDFIAQELITRSYLATDRKDHEAALSRVTKIPYEDTEARLAMERKNGIELIQQMLTTGQPQILALADRTGRTGHAVAVYAYKPEEGIFLYYDPSDSSRDKKEHTLEWNYDDGYGQASSKLGQSVAWEYFAFTSYHSAVSSAFLSSLHDQAEAGFPVSDFPDIIFDTLSEDPNNLDTYTPESIDDDGNVIVSGGVSRPVEAENSNKDRYLHVYLDGEPYEFESPVLVGNDLSPDAFEFALELGDKPALDVILMVSEAKETWRMGLHAFNHFTLLNPICDDLACIEIMSAHCEVLSSDRVSWSVTAKVVSKETAVIPMTSVSPSQGVAYLTTWKRNNCTSWTGEYDSYATIGRGGPPSETYCGRKTGDPVSTLVTATMDSFNLEAYQLVGQVWQTPGGGDIMYDYFRNRVADTRINDLKCQDYPSF